MYMYMFVTSLLSKKENAILRYFEKPFNWAAIIFYFIGTLRILSQDSSDNLKICYVLLAFA